MANTRKEKPDWFQLCDKLKAIVEIEAGTYQDLCAFVDVAPARYFEWVSGKREPSAQKALMIQKWVKCVEDKIFGDAVFTAAYGKELRNVKKS